MTLTDPATDLAYKLGESEPKAVRQIRRVLGLLDNKAIVALFIATEAIEENGGLLIRRGTARRTKGGVFFELVRRYLISIGQRKEAKRLRAHPRRLLKKRAIQGFAPPGPGRVRFRKRGSMGLSVFPVSFAQALSTANTLIPSDARCLKIGANQQDSVLILHFAFPDIARVRYEQVIESIIRSTNWRVVIYPRPNQAELMRLATAMLDTPLRGLPGVRPQDRSVIARCEQPVLNAAQIQECFEQETGWRLIVKTIAP